MTDELCECPWVDPSLWTTHYGAVDPATTQEYNPDCPVHGGSNDDSIRSLVKERHFADNYGQGGASPVYIAPVYFVPSGMQLFNVTPDETWRHVGDSMSALTVSLNRLGVAFDESARAVKKSLKASFRFAMPKISAEQYFVLFGCIKPNGKLILNNGRTQKRRRRGRR